GIVNCQTRINDTPRRVDIHVDLTIRVLPVQIQQLGHNQIGNLVIDRCSQQHNPLFQQQRENIVGAFAPAPLLYDHRKYAVDVHNYADSPCTSESSSPASGLSATSSGASPLPMLAIRSIT